LELYLELLEEKDITAWSLQKREKENWLVKLDLQ
jgi:hypothetical protein